MERIIRAGLAFAVSIAFTTAAGCGGNGGNTGGSGGAGTGGGGTATGGSTATGGGGTGGSAPSACIAATQFSSFFSIADDGFCAVAVYDADQSLVDPVTMVPQAPSWGSHGGPLWFVPDATGGGVTLERWTLPAGTTGKLTKQTTHVDAMIPAGSFAGAQAIDTPFFGWTAISWTGAFPDTTGKILMIANGAIDRTYDVNGAFALAAAGDATSGRLLFTGLSPIGMPTTNTNGFYGADACDMPKPDLGAGQGCSASAEIAAWGDSSGPLAVDGDGNAFVVLASFGTGDQEARGFAAAEVARGAAPAMGTKLFTLPGFGSSLAAIKPSGGKPGKLVFQPFDMTATPQDVIAQPYVASGGVSAQGTPGKLLAMPPGGAISLSLFTDDKDRLWVAAAHDQTTTFVVIAPKP